VKRALALSLVLLLVAVPAVAEAKKAKKVKASSVSVTFTVRNTSTSAFPCASDGATYQVQGHITGPASALSSALSSAISSKTKKKRKPPKGVTLYLHGLGLGEWMWALPGVPSYNYALQQARAGHISVTVDRIGYGASGHPDGNQSCIGSQSDVAHQIVQALKTGTYARAVGKPVRYKRVALAGHSAGGEIAILEAYSYRDISALIVVGFSYSNLAAGNIAFGNQRNVCTAGGIPPASAGGAPNYAFFGQTPAEFEQTMFHSAPKNVRDVAIPLHNPDPCGDNLSLIDALNTQRAGAPKIKVPAVVLCGARDVLYAPFGCEAQAERFGGKDKRTIIIGNAGHALPLEKTAGTFRSKLGRWLSRRGF
jgi:pimeloyl-ACP methyl ester carboxylesterase